MPSNQIPRNRKKNKPISPVILAQIINTRKNTVVIHPHSRIPENATGNKNSQHHFKKSMFPKIHLIFPLLSLYKTIFSRS